ncbi:MAG: hypothetical protein ACUVV6_04840 [Thermoplasmatota archaeon]
MTDILAPAAAALLLGLLRGLSLCLLVRAPGLVPVLVSEGSGPLRSLYLALLLSLPRLLLLTALGALLGLISFGVASSGPARALFAGASVTAYFLIGALMLVVGGASLLRGGGARGARVGMVRP